MFIAGSFLGMRGLRIIVTAIMAIGLFLGFLLLGVLDLRRAEPYPAGPFITFDLSALVALTQ
jgi:hypothetical protein